MCFKKKTMTIQVFCSALTAFASLGKFQKLFAPRLPGCEVVMNGSYSYKLFSTTSKLQEELSICQNYVSHVCSSCSG